MEHTKNNIMGYIHEDIKNSIYKVIIDNLVNLLIEKREELNQYQTTIDMMVDDLKFCLVGDKESNNYRELLIANTVVMKHLEIVVKYGYSLDKSRLITALREGVFHANVEEVAEVIKIIRGY